MAQAEKLETPPLLQELLELVARQLRLERGRATLEVRFEEGHLRDCFRHEGPIGASSLQRFEAIPPE